MTGRSVYAVLIVGAVILCGVLSLYQATDAAPKAPDAPFANAVEQRMEMINELKEIRALLKEQNALIKEQNELLRSGTLKVVISQAEKP
jgi:hypothetical protein